MARWSEDGGDVHVWSHSQGIHILRDAIAQALGIDPERVTVEHAENAGCYGHNGADDAAFDAVLLARTVPGRPVQVRWSRGDELTWAPLASAMSVDLAATLVDGRITGWRHEVWSQGHTTRPGYAGVPGLLACQHLADAPPAPAAVDPPHRTGGGTTLYADLKVDGVGATIPLGSLNTVGSNGGGFGIDFFTSAGNTVRLGLNAIDLLVTNNVMFFTGTASVISQNMPFGLQFDTSQPIVFSYTATLPGLVGGNPHTIDEHLPGLRRAGLGLDGRERPLRDVADREQIEAHFSRAARWVTASAGSSGRGASSRSGRSRRRRGTRAPRTRARAAPSWRR